MLERGQSRWSTYPQGPQGQNTGRYTVGLHTTEHLWSPTERRLAVNTHAAGRSTHRVTIPRFTHTLRCNHTWHSQAHTPINNHDIITPASPHVKTVFSLKRRPQPNSRDPRPLEKRGLFPTPTGPCSPPPRLGRALPPPTYHLWKEVGQERLDFWSPRRGPRFCWLRPADLSGSE